MSKRQIPSSQRPEPQPFSCGLSTRAWASGRVAGPSPAAGRTPCWRPASCPRPGWRGLASDVGYDGAGGLARLVRLQVGYQEPRLLVALFPAGQQRALQPPLGLLGENATPRPCHRHFTRGTSAVTGTLFFDRPLLNLPSRVTRIIGCQPKATISW